MDALDHAQARIESLAYQVGYALGMLRGIVREIDAVTPFGPRGSLADARRYAIDAIRKLEGN